MTSQLNLVKQMFPFEGNQIDELYEHNFDFKSTCLDFFYCIQTLQSIEREILDREELLKEYEQLKQDLLKELGTYIPKKM